MGRLLVTLAIVFSLLLGTGAFNVACLCTPGGGCGVGLAFDAAGSCATADSADEPAESSGCGSCCCAEPGPDDPADRDVPGKRTPERCPCLYWTGVPLSTPDASTGTSLVKRAMECAPVLLLEAVSASVTHETAAIIRAGPPVGRDTRTRPQAWLCVWTI